MLERLMRSSAEVSVLGVVLFEDGLYLREISRKARVSSSETKRELDNLVSIGVLDAEKKGKQVFFYLNPSCHFLKELKQLYLKTEGIAAELKHASEQLKGIKYAFIFGSVAGERERRRSDVDLMVIGDVSEEKFAAEMMKVQQTFSREINFILWSESDFNRKLLRKTGFLKNIYERKKVWLFGDENEFGRIVKEAFSRTDRSG